MTSLSVIGDEISYVSYGHNLQEPKFLVNFKWI